MATPRKFARIFDSEKYGQILVCADQNDEGNPFLTIKCDTHPDHLNPTLVGLGFSDETDQFEKLESFTQEQAEGFAEAIKKQADQFTGMEGA